MRCPGCGEALYAGEERCWRCGYELAAAPPPPPPATAPLAVPRAVALPTAAPAPPTAATVTPAVGRGASALVLAVMGLVFPCLAPVFSVLALREAARAGEAEAAGIVTIARVVAVGGLVVFAVGLAAVGLGLALQVFNAR